MHLTSRFAIILLVGSLWLAASESEAGVIKDLFYKVTGSNNQTEDLVRESSPICGSGVFSTPDERTLSPEIIFITDRPARSEFVHQQQNNNHREDDRNRNNDSQREDGAGRERRRQDRQQVSEVAREFRFHVENVTLEELERHGFNRDAPVSFLMHGFTSGYPLQAWISSIVEAYTIDRDSSRPLEASNQQGGREARQRLPGAGSDRLKHNLFIINWHYAARGILYPRAVANIPIVATYMTRFINDKIIGEAGVEPRKIELIGHSLGAHLAGFIGKNTRSKLGKIYGLDPAGPCFGSITGKLYPSNRRLAPGDADEVITIHTNSALLGIDKPLGKYSIFVEGGANQPGCRDGGLLKSLGSISTEGAEKVSCSHSRAPNLFTYRLGQAHEAEECQMVAYECKDWEAFKEGQCGVCATGREEARSSSGELPRSVQCKRMGLEWQYGDAPTTSGYDDHNNNRGPGRRTTSRRPSYGEETYENYNAKSSSRRPYNSDDNNSDDDQYNSDNNRFTSTTRRARFMSSTSSPYSSDNDDQDEAGYRRSTTRRSRYLSSSTRPPASEVYENQPDNYQARNASSHRDRYSSTIRPNYGYDRNRREANNTSTRRKSDSNVTSTDTTAAASANVSTDGDESQSRRAQDFESTTSSMFIKTADTQPYCVFHYQVILELNEPFRGKKPPISLILQDSQSEGVSREVAARRNNNEQNSLTYDEIGHKYNDKIYTHLLTSSSRLKRVDHATLLFRNGLPEGNRILKSLHINYMSNVDPSIRRKFSSRLCLVKKHQEGQGSSGENRFYFEPCDSNQPGHQSSHNNNSNNNYNNYNYQENNYTNEQDNPAGGHRSSSRRPSQANNGNYNSNYD